MDLYDFLYLAKEFNDMGWAIQEQLQSIVDGEDLEEQNVNALRHISRLLNKLEAHDVDTDGLAERVEEHVLETMV